jgi:hypothetical protein
MKTNVRNSSLDAYYGELVASGLAAQQAKVLVVMKHLGGGWASRTQISEVSVDLFGRYDQLRINAVTGRVNGLLRCGILEEQETQSPCPVTGRSVYLVRIAEKGEVAA